MPYSLEIFCRREQYEPSTTWYGPSADLLASPGALAAQIADAMAYLVSSSAQFTRWELFNAVGVKVNEGPLVDHYGTFGGDLADPKYFVLVRKNVEGEAEKPSVVYLPFPPTGVMLNGELSPTAATAFALMSAALLENPVWNSDGLPVQSYTFRHFTRRKKVRRVL